MHRSISPTIPRLTSPDSASLVRGSRTCSCVALSLLSLVVARDTDLGFSATPESLGTFAFLAGRGALAGAVGR